MLAQSACARLLEACATDRASNRRSRPPWRDCRRRRRFRLAPTENGWLGLPDHQRRVIAAPPRRSPACTPSSTSSPIACIRLLKLTMAMSSPGVPQRTASVSKIVVPWATRSPSRRRGTAGAGKPAASNAADEPLAAGAKRTLAARARRVRPPRSPTPAAARLAMALPAAMSSAIQAATCCQPPPARSRTGPRSQPKPQRMAKSRSRALSAISARC